MTGRRSRPLHRGAIAVVLAALATVTVACSGGGSGDDPGAARPGPITVSAAASLTESFERIGADFERTPQGQPVTFNFDSSGTLATQITEGAPVDVFASADEQHMTTVVDAGDVAGTPTVFARNRLVIVTKPGNPTGIASLADLATAGVVALCSLDAPCGTFAQQALTKARVTIDERSVTRGQNVKATLTAITEGDAVAAVVYVTDAAAAGTKVATVEIPAAQNVVASYPVAVITGSDHAAVARAFVAYLQGPEAQAVLRDHGFLPPA